MKSFKKKIYKYIKMAEEEYQQQDNNIQENLDNMLNEMEVN